MTEWTYYVGTLWHTCPWRVQTAVYPDKQSACQCGAVVPKEWR